MRDYQETCFAILTTILAAARMTSQSEAAGAGEAKPAGTTQRCIPLKTEITVNGNGLSQ